MTSILQTYEFELTKTLREDGLKRAAYIRSVNQDIATEMDYDMATKMDYSLSPLPFRWILDVTGHSLVLRILIPAEDARFLEVAMHNLHGAKLLEQKFSKELK